MLSQLQYHMLCRKWYGHYSGKQRGSIWQKRWRRIYAVNVFKVENKNSFFFFFVSSQVRSAKVTWDRVEWRQRVRTSMTVSICSLNYQVAIKPQLWPHSKPSFCINAGQNIVMFVMFHDDIMTVDCGNHTKRVNILWWRNVGRCFVVEQSCHLMRENSTAGGWANANRASVEWYWAEGTKCSGRKLSRRYCVHHKISHGLTWYWTRFFAVRDGLLRVWAMALTPCRVVHIVTTVGPIWLWHTLILWVGSSIRMKNIAATLRIRERNYAMAYICSVSELRRQ